MKAPDPEGEDPIKVVPSRSDVDLEYAFHQKELRDFLALDPVMRRLELKQIEDLQDPLAPPQRTTGKLDAVKGLMSLLREASLVVGRFDANDLFNLDLDQIRSSTQDLFDRLKARVGEIQPKPDLAMPEPGLPTHIGSTGCRTASPYVSAAEGSDTSYEPRRMALGPSGAAMLQARSQIQQGEKSKPRSKSRFLKEQQALPSPPKPTGIQNPGSQDVEMESTRSPDPDPHWKYDPDDIDLPTTDRAEMATMTTGSTGSTMIRRVRISVISDLREFAGKDQDGDRARACYPDPPATSGLTCSVASRSSTVDLGSRWLASITTLASDPAKPRWRDQELADRLTLLRLPDADELEEVLRALDRAKNRHKKSAFGSNRFRQKAPANPAAAAKHVRAIQIRAPDSGSDDSGSERSDSDCDEHRRIYTTANQDNARSAGEEPNGLDRIGRSLGWNPVRAELSRYCIYAFVHKPAVDPGNKQRDLHGNTFDLCGKRTPVVSSVCQANDYSRSSETLVMDLDPGCRRGYWKQRDPDLWFDPAVGEMVTKIPGFSRAEAYYSMDVLDLLPGESRVYWKQHSPGKWFRQAKIHGKINNVKAILLLDTGAEVSIVDTAFARKVGCYIDRRQSQECVGTLPESMVERLKYQTPRAILRTLDPACTPPTEVEPSGSGGRQDKSSLDPTEQPNTKDTVTPARVSEARRQSPEQRSRPDPDNMVTGERSLDPDPGDDQLKGDDNQNPDPATGDSLALLNSTAGLGVSSETQDSERARDPAVGEEIVLAVAVSSGNHSETGDGPADHGAVGEKKTPDPADLRVFVDGQRKQVVGSHRERDQAPDPTDSLDPRPDDSTADEQSTQGGAPREKLSDLIKGLLGAKIISVSTSPWASPIVVIIKKNGVDIRLCIDYRLVNSLTRLMIYPMPLINDLLEDLNKVLWYCSLDMASGFWVVTMTDRACAISAFITPFGLFEWNRMPFGLKNAPQIYQRMLDNALYGFTRIPRPGSSGFDIGGSKLDGSGSDEVSTDQSQDESLDLIKPSVLGRRSYIDDILVTAGSWDHLCDRVEDLLDACDRWNLSISMVNSFWGKSKVEYLGHQVSSSGLEANPKDLAALTDLPFPQSLRSMQSFLGSLNYYSRFIEDYAIYAAVLYEL
ncbi:unnamed protein product [Phytophthora fragariaefolia]|uniref:Unnamed protein product n=1 Tax=Phytophthora fragariaefolia TaxID=1490495 RepID=A0A9W6UA03_9STRA|nr:unnamed protein product [Phytophthora fragariaefolia]